MENYFDREVEQINREILQLKTSNQKSAGIVPTIAKTISVDLSMQLDSQQIDCSGSATYKLIPDSDSLIMVTLEIYYDDITKNSDFPRTTRQRNYILSRKSNGDIILYLYAFGNNNDVNTLKNGGTVKISVKATIRCTDDFTIERQ